MPQQLLVKMEEGGLIIMDSGGQPFGSGFDAEAAVDRFQRANVQCHSSDSERDIFQWFQP